MYFGFFILYIYMVYCTDSNIYIAIAKTKLFSIHTIQFQWIYTYRYKYIASHKQLRQYTMILLVICM